MIYEDLWFILITCRSSHWRYSIKKVVLKNFAKSTGKHLCQSLFFNKVAGVRCFPVNFAKLLGTHLRNTSWRLLLDLHLINPDGSKLGDGEEGGEGGWNKQQRGVPLASLYKSNKYRTGILFESLV